MYKMPLVSVIIPCYNGENFIREAIESVISQSYQNWELIIVDDGSKDNSKWIVQQYLSNKRIKLIEHASNEGIPKTKNDGLAISKGEYVAFLDQDDIWMPNKLEMQVKFFDYAGNNVGLVCTGMIFVDEKMRKKAVFLGLNDENQKALLERQYWDPINSSSVMMLTRKCLSQIGIFDESIRGWDDYEILMRVATQFDVKYVKEPLVLKRIHPKSAQGLPIIRNETEKVYVYIRKLHPFLRKYEGCREFYEESIDLLKQGKKDIARRQLKRSIARHPRYFRAWCLYILSFLPGQFPLKVKSLILNIRNMAKVFLALTVRQSS